MLSLAIDTSANLCAAAIHDGAANRLIGEVTEDIGKGHAERLIDLLNRLVGDCAVGFDQVDAIFCVAGPGSFTGIRIGLATAKGLGLALDKPVFGLSLLEAMAQEAALQGQWNGTAPLLVALDARREEFFCQLFGDTEIPEPFLARYDDDKRLRPLLRLENLAVCGSGAAKLAQHVPWRNLPILHELAAAPIACIASMGANRPDTRLAAEPLYFRPADAKLQVGFEVARR